MFDLLLCLGINSEHINKAFTGLSTLMDDLNMCEEFDKLPDVIEEELKHKNPFDAFLPTDRLIRTMYNLAEKTIKEKYPNAEIRYSANGYNSYFKVDDTTYKKGLEERKVAYFE